MKNIIENNFWWIDSESWKAHLIAVVLILIPTIVYLTFGKILI